MAEPAVSRRTYVFTFFGLVGLTLATTGIAFIDLGAFNTVVAIAIAGAKALLIALFFMHLIHSESLIRVIAIGGLIWLAILVTLTFGDYFTRGWLGVPGK